MCAHITLTRISRIFSLDVGRVVKTWRGNVDLVSYAEYSHTLLYSVAVSVACAAYGIVL